MWRSFQKSLYSTRLRLSEMDTVQIEKKSKLPKFIRAVNVQLGCLFLSSSPWLCSDIEEVTLVNKRCN